MKTFRKSIFAFVALVMTVCMMTSCSIKLDDVGDIINDVVDDVVDGVGDIFNSITNTEITSISDSETVSEVYTGENVSAPTAEIPPETESTEYVTKTNLTESQTEKLSVEKDGSYTTPEDVAEYIHTFGTLPKNFITKSEAQALGWESSKGNLWDVAPDMSIGGDYFGNYEGLLPKADGRKYTECDVNYTGGYRGSERVIFSNDGLIFYTNDHYETFTQLY